MTDFTSHKKLITCNC